MSCCRENLYSNFALELEIGGAIDGTHTAASEFAVEPVAFAQDCAGTGDSGAQLIRKDEGLLGVDHATKNSGGNKEAQNFPSVIFHFSSLICTRNAMTNEK